MNFYKELADFIDQLIYTDLITQPEGYQELKDEALEKLGDAQAILEKIGL